jgi:hypothetical protein
MKFYFIIISFILAQAASAQEDVNLKGFVKSFERNFTIPANIDTIKSCLNLSSLLKVEIDSDCKVLSISFSDIAQDWQKAELKRIKDKLDIKSIEKYFKGKSKGSLTILFPFIVQNGDMTCADNKGGYFSKQFFLFDEKNINGNCLFADPILLIYY